MKLNQNKFLVVLMTLVWINVVGATLPAAAEQLSSWPGHQAVSLQPKRTIQVVNIWATWCHSCRQEIPFLGRWIQQQQRQAGSKAPELIGVVIDSEANLRRFSQEVKIGYPLLRYSGQDSRAWMQELGNNIGGLPFTLVRAPRCEFSQTLLGSVNATKLNQAVSAARAQCERKGIK